MNPLDNLVLVLFQKNIDLQIALKLDTLLQDLGCPENTLPHSFLFGSQLIYNHMPEFHPAMLKILIDDGLLYRVEGDELKYKLTPLGESVVGTNYYYKKIRQLNQKRFFSLCAFLAGTLLTLSQLFVNALEIYNFYKPSVSP